MPRTSSDDARADACCPHQRGPTPIDRFLDKLRCMDNLHVSSRKSIDLWQQRLQAEHPKANTSRSATTFIILGDAPVAERASTTGADETAALASSRQGSSDMPFASSACSVLEPSVKSVQRAVEGNTVPFMSSSAGAASSFAQCIEDVRSSIRRVQAEKQFPCIPCNDRFHANPSSEDCPSNNHFTVQDRPGSSDFERLALELGAQVGRLCSSTLSSTRQHPAGSSPRHGADVVEGSAAAEGSRSIAVLRHARRVHTASRMPRPLGSSAHASIVTPSIPQAMFLNLPQKFHLGDLGEELAESRREHRRRRGRSSSSRRERKQ